MGRTAVLAFLVAACLAKPPRPDGTDPDPQCGDSIDQPGEPCDDGNLDDGDGCSSACAIEPWFECPAVGTPCHPVLGIQWISGGDILPAIGNTAGGQLFEDDCKDVIGVNGRTTVIVGFEAGPSGDSIGGLRMHCADVALQDDGAIAWSTDLLTTERGDSPGPPLATQRCDSDEVVTGFEGNSSASSVSGLQLICQAPVHRGGTLTFGARRNLPVVGPANQIARPAETCEDLFVARAVVGSSGAIIDSFGLRCVRSLLVVCGDGQVVPPETCDDGNAIAGDGCNATCDGD